MCPFSFSLTQGINFVPCFVKRPHLDIVTHCVTDNLVYLSTDARVKYHQ